MRDDDRSENRSSDGSREPSRDWNDWEHPPAFACEPSALFDGRQIGPGTGPGIGPGIDPEHGSAVFGPYLGGLFAAPLGNVPFGADQLRRALRELRAIHRAEQSILLAHAAEYRLAAVQRRVLRFPLLAPGFGLAPEGHWRRSLFAEWHFAQEDGVPFSPLLRPFCTGDPDGSPSALDPARLASGAVRETVRLARAAVALEAWPEAHLTLARAWLAFGSPDRAEAALDTFDASPGVDWNAPLARALSTAAIGVRAACAEWRGDLDRALEGFQQQLERNPAAHAAAMVLLLAAELGDVEAHRSGARALAGLEHGAHSGVPGELDCLTACIRSHRRATEGAPLTGRALPGRGRGPMGVAGASPIGGPTRGSTGGPTGGSDRPASARTPECAQGTGELDAAPGGGPASELRSHLRRVRAPGGDGRVPAAWRRPPEGNLPAGRWEHWIRREWLRCS